MTVSVKVNQSKKVGGRRFKEDLHQAVFLFRLSSQNFIYQAKRKRAWSQVKLPLEVRLTFSFLSCTLPCGVHISELKHGRRRRRRRRQRKLHFFPRLIQFARNVKSGRLSLELTSWGTHLSLDKERKILRRLFTSSTKREIMHFHVVVVQRRQGNVQ